MRRLAVLLLPLLLAGCTAGLADAVKALGQDPATICATVTSIYGTVRIARTNINHGSVTCSQDGMSVKSETGEIGR